MKHTFFRFLFCLILVLCNSPKVEAQFTTVGKEFWLGFMENNTSGNNGKAVVVISANERTQGTIDLSNLSSNLTYNFDLQPGESYTMRIPENELDLLHRNSGIIENKGIFITSTGDISVYAFNERFKSADGTVVLPLSTLGKDYLITSHFETAPNKISGVELNENNESIILVVGVEDNTKVEITPSVTTVDGKKASVPIYLNLNAGQSYQLKARGDLTGSRIRVMNPNTQKCQNIAVFAGNKWGTVGECGSAPDHLFQQMYPVHSFGENYIHIPLKTRSSGELVKIVATEDNTVVNFDGNPVRTLGEGEWFTHEFEPDKPVSIESSKPISVTTFAKSRDCNVKSDLFYAYGDPFMLTYSPNNRLLTDVTFESMDIVQISYHYVNILVRTESKGSTILDGKNLGSKLQPVPGNSEFSFARIKISGGEHRLSNPNGFIAYAYGFGDLESYGYATGANLRNLDFNTETFYDEFEVIGDNVTCLSNEFTWEIKATDPKLDHFVWYIGDDIDPKVGGNIRYLFENPGKYDVTIFASEGEKTCAEAEKFTFQVEVLESTATMLGDSLVCPGANESSYELMDMQNISRVEWKVIGGEILSFNNKSATVLWQLNSADSYIMAIPFTYEGCPGIPIIKNVMLSQEMDPSAPIGSNEVCFDPSTIYNYSVSEKLENRGYQWFISNGKILSSTDSSTVEVQWDTPNSTGKIWYEEHSLININCHGISEELEVNVHEALDANYSVTNVSCSGESSGQIILSATGGLEPYIYKWGHDTILMGKKAEGLTVGTYFVEITDALGCSIVVDNIKVEEPEELNSTVLNNSGTSCYGKSDGEVQIMVTGGTMPYQINYENAMIDNKQINLFGLANKDYQFIITDAKGCETFLSAYVDSPEPLQVDVNVIQRPCPGGAEGELMANVSGGIKPYEYTWDYNSETGPQLSGVPNGGYSVTVQDGNGCIGFGSDKLLEKVPQVRMPTGFYPKGVGIDGIYKPISNCPVSFHLYIYNRWGELIYTGSEGWDGIVLGDYALSGTYTYFLEYMYEIDEIKYNVQKRGLFTLIN